MKIAALCIFLLVLAVAGCAGGISELPQEPDSPVLSLTVATMPALESFPIFIAEAQGFFEDEGLNVSLEQFFNPVDRDIAFQSNERIDGMVFDLVQLIIYQSAGIDIVAVMSSVGMASVIGAEGVYRIEDLRGQNVLMTTNTSMDYIIDRTLASEGLSVSDIIIDEVPALPTRLEMLLHGHAAGAVLPDPFALIALDAGLNHISTTTELGINPFVFAFRREVTENNLTALKAFYRAISRAVDFLNTADPQLYLDMLIAKVGYPEHFRDSLILPYFPPYSIPRREIVQDVLDFSYARGLHTAPLTVSQLIFDIGN